MADNSLDRGNEGMRDTCKYEYRSHTHITPNTRVPRERVITGHVYSSVFFLLHPITALSETQFSCNMTVWKETESREEGNASIKKTYSVVLFVNHQSKVQLKPIQIWLQVLIKKIHNHLDYWSGNIRGQKIHGENWNQLRQRTWMTFLI